MGNSVDVECNKSFRVIKFDKLVKYRPPKSSEIFEVEEAILIDDQRLMLISEGKECHTIYRDTLNQLTDVLALSILEGIMIWEK